MLGFRKTKGTMMFTFLRPASPVRSANRTKPKPLNLQLEVLEERCVPSGYETLDVPGAHPTFAIAINASGQVVGSYGAGGMTHGFLWSSPYSSSDYITLDPPGSGLTNPVAINTSGQVVGDYWSNGDHGFLYSNGTYITLDPPGSLETDPCGINDAGQIVGSYIGNGTGEHGFLYSGGSYVTLDGLGHDAQAFGINASGQVVGHYYDTSGLHGFLYSGGSYIPLDGPGSHFTEAFGINSSGQVIGHYYDTQDHGFLASPPYGPGDFITLDPTSSTSGSTASAINDAGQVVGDYSDNSGGHPFLYSGGSYTTLVVPGSGNTFLMDGLQWFSAGAINAAGYVVGGYQLPSDVGNNSKIHGFLYSPFNLPPTAHLTNPTVSSSSAGSTTVGLTLTASDQSALNQTIGFTFTITWGDGTAIQTIGPSTNNGSGVTVSHTYADGSYLVQVTCQDNDGLVSQTATALVVASTAPADQITLTGGSSTDRVSVAIGAGQPATFALTDLAFVSGQGGSDNFTVNVNTSLTVPITIWGSNGTTGGDTLTIYGPSGAPSNQITKTAATITFTNPIDESITYNQIQNVVIYADSTTYNVISDPGSRNTTLVGGPGNNTFIIGNTVGNGVLVKGGPSSNSYVINMGNLLGPVTINSTSGTCTVTINGPPGSNTLTLTSAQLSGAGAPINFNLGTTATNLTVNGGAGNNQLVILGSPPAARVTFRNIAPTVGSVTAPLNPNAVQTLISASASFTNPDGASQTAVWDWGDHTTSAGTVMQTGTSGTVTGSHSYAVDGVYTITLKVIDKGGAFSTSIFKYEVIYDPSAGFVTGGGWITSPIGAYVANPSLTGKSNFGFNAKYHTNSTIPEGDTEYQFAAANLDFHSTSDDWLVITGAQAQYQGSGTINGIGNYGFLITALDGKQPGGGGVDKLRFKIWDKNNANVVIYDTQMSAPVTDGPTTALGGGAVTVNGGHSSPPPSAPPGRGDHEQPLMPGLLEGSFAFGINAKEFVGLSRTPPLLPTAIARAIPSTLRAEKALLRNRQLIVSTSLLDRRAVEVVMGSWLENSLNDVKLDWLAINPVR